MKIKPVEDGNSNFELVELKKSVPVKGWKEKLFGRKTPHCKIHGAMLKVSPGIPGMWRCVIARPEKKFRQKFKDCRAGCVQIK